MCSIGGWQSASPISAADARRLNTALLWYGRDRGRQSAGLLYGTMDRNNKLKRSMDANKLINLSEFDTLHTEPGTFALTHTRSPTSGGHGDQQAQPFTSGPATTVHNGMFYDEFGLRDRWSINSPSGVDSELVTTFLAKHGPMELPQFLESTIGPSAIAARYNDDMYLIRSGNPCWSIHFLTPDEVPIIVFASTSQQLLSAIGHTWLIPQTITPIETAEGVLLHVTPAGLEPLSEPIKHTDQNWSRWGEDWDLPGDGGYANEYQRKIATLYFPQQRTSNAQITQTAKKRKEPRPDRRYKGNRRSY